MLLGMPYGGATGPGRRARELARVPLPTRFGLFESRAFECSSGSVYLALVRGDVEGRDGVLTRVHSECLTGDTLGSLRCDCGLQLQLALQAIASATTGVLIYATGHEGRGIGLINKLRTYLEQDLGADTLDANLRLGLPVDGRDYTDAAAVLHALDVRSVQLLTNNPGKVEGLRSAGVTIGSVQALATAPHTRNLAYLRTKERRLGHVHPTGEVMSDSGRAAVPLAVDATELIGRVSLHDNRPYVVLKYAQTIDGRIATSTGDSKWISGEGERRISHALRAACDAVLVGVGTVIQDDPQLTVRMVPGVTPARVVLDSTLRLPSTARMLEPDAPTIILTTERSDPRRRELLRRQHVGVQVLPAGPDGVDLNAALATLRQAGVETLLAEGGAKVITSMLAGDVVDRLIVGVAPTIIGRGMEAVGSLGTTKVREGITLHNRAMHVLADDVVFSWDVARNGCRPG
jgi:GTP cyclohydrolase II